MQNLKKQSFHKAIKGVALTVSCFSIFTIIRRTYYPDSPLYFTRKITNFITCVPILQIANVAAIICLIYIGIKGDKLSPDVKKTLKLISITMITMYLIIFAFLFLIVLNWGD